MYSQKLIRVAKKLSAIASREYPDVDECDLRIALAGALFQVTEEYKILHALFPEGRVLEDNGSDLV